MFRLSAVVLGVVAVFGLVGLAPARQTEDNAKKITGKWEVTKSETDVPAGSTIEFTADGKLSVQVKGDKNEKVQIEGTYKVEKDKLTIKVKVAEQMYEDTMSIQKLTGEVMEIKHNDGKVDELKKK